MELPHDTDNKQLNRRTIAQIGAGALLVAGSIFMYSHFNPETPRTIEHDYPLHENITATVFWVGEEANESNDYIHNRSSAWTKNWVAAYGGVDSYDDRCGFLPCDFTPRENPFYFALPFSDYDENGLKPADELQVIPWYDGEIEAGTSVLKNRWIKVTHDSTVAYAQWEDVGPFKLEDADYVFGSAQPAEPRAGLDMSPALADYLGIDGRETVSWRFVEESDVPPGEWTKIITRSNPQF
ncbi:MAG TPA: hypothetical protein VFM68_02010 [Candidatus Saccharimonadales bacterium]|nr:hypothetical protein [Candidatus Saccharimonadales bacterium]